MQRGKTVSEIALFPVGVIGAGTMGAGIAQLAAQHNHPVHIYDSNHEQLLRARHSIEKSLKIQVEKKKLSSDDAEAALSRIVLSHELSGLDRSRIVVEAILENIEVKQEVFKNVEAVVSESCILASNTSSLSIASIASLLKHPERVLGIHFFNPAVIMPLVEIVPGVATYDMAVDRARSLIDSWGKTTIVAKDTPGFVVNRVARPFYGESIRVLEEGVADIATIDWAMKEIGGFRMGPFELMDFIGIDINFKVTQTVFEAFFYDPRYRPSLTQQRLYEAKRFGRKTGQGFYDYADGQPLQKATENRELGEQIFMRVISMLINEAVDALFLNIATRDDIDLAVTKGVNYPKGLLKWADDLGLEKVLNQLMLLQEEYGEDRYRPSPLLRRMVKAGKTFY